MSADSMKPFFTYYGGKWRAAPSYPAPLLSRVVEPFAGSAGYSLRYPHLEIELFDVSPVVAGVWEYLISVSESEIRNLPAVVEHVDDVPGAQEARWLVGFWLNKGTPGPRKQASSWMRSGLRPNSYWGEAIRERIASQLEGIRHWKVTCGDYREAGDGVATWFVDPPYDNAAGAHYPFNFADFFSLGEWCRSRAGQVIVCENEGADWLPFRTHRKIKSNPGNHGKSYSKEVIWTAGADWKKMEEEDED